MIKDSVIPKCALSNTMITCPRCEVTENLVVLKNGIGVIARFFAWGTSSKGRKFNMECRSCYFPFKLNLDE